MKTMRKWLCLLLTVAMLVPGLTVSAGSSFSVKPEYQSLKDFNGGKIGIWIGTFFDQIADEYFPDSEQLFYSNAADMSLALIQGKIDGFICDEPIGRVVENQYPAITKMEDMLSVSDYGYAFAKTDKGAALCEEFNAFLKEWWENGKMQELDDYWFSETEEEKRIPELWTLPNINGEFTVAFYDVGVFCYTQELQKTGYCVEMIYDFCKEKGYSVSYESISDVSSGLLGVKSGKYDCLATILEPTEERKESTNFSDCVYSGGTVLMVRNTAYDANGKISLSSVDGIRMGIWSGSKFDTVCQENFPNCERLLYNGSAELALALSQDKIDGFICDEPVARLLLKEYPSFAIIEEMIVKEDYSFLFAKNEDGTELQTEFNEFLAQYRAEGRLDALNEIWFGDDETLKTTKDLASLPSTNGTIRTSVISLEPFTYLQDNQIVGYCVDLFYDFCKSRGYGATCELLNDASSCILGTSSGKYDVFVSIAGVTEERKASMLFSDSVYDGGLVVVIRDPNAIAADAEKDKSWAEENNFADRELEYSTWEELSGKTLGCLTGSVQDELIGELFPDSERQYYTTFAELLLALQNHKIDAYIVDNNIAEDIMTEYPDVGVMEQEVYSASICYAVNKDRQDLCDQLNAYLADIRASGKREEIRELWEETEDETLLPTFDFSDLPDVNGTISVGYSYSEEPMNYMQNGKPAGFEINLLYDFCKEYGYAVDAEESVFSSLLAGCSTGAYDIAAGSMMWTEERAESALMTDAFEESVQLVLVRTKNVSSTKSSLWASISSSFEKNFLREDRWKLVLSGIGVTLLITLLSAVFGTLLGFILCALYRSGNKIAVTVISALVRFVQGIPVVVLLMVLYYILFAGVDISGILVGIIGFSINFAVYVCEILRTGIGAVDAGQWEAASALGFSKAKTFIKVVFPQALRHILPVYEGEFISMLKMTSVVGYIAVQDLTKVSDIIRSRTYDALFPLLATALIYFLLSAALTSLLFALVRSIDPRKRKNVLKGIDPEARTEVEEKPVQGEKGETLITLQHLRKEYETVTPLEDVCTEIHRGDVISVIGPSGTGKSTLLRCINRLENPTAGSVVAFGESIPDKGKTLCAFRMRVGMVFQSFNLFSHLTVIENLMLAPVELLGISRQEAYQRGMELLGVVGLTDKALSYPDELSGGQKQRVAIVRTLAMRPEVILFDEPTSALDPTMVGEVLSVIRSMAEKGYTMMIVTHEMKFARDVSNRVFYMDEGGIYEDGSPEQVFAHPAKERTRAFVNHIKLFHYEIPSSTFDYVEFFNAINNFCHEELMTPQKLEKLEHCVEELVVGALTRAEIQYPARCSIEYVPEGETTLLLSYVGDACNVLMEMDKLSYVLLERYSTSFGYSYADGENLVTVKL